jgi:hypothetical protein
VDFKLHHYQNAGFLVDGRTNGFLQAGMLVSADVVRSEVERTTCASRFEHDFGTPTERRKADLESFFTPKLPFITICIGNNTS